MNFVLASSVLIRYSWLSHLFKSIALHRELQNGKCRGSSLPVSYSNLKDCPQMLHLCFNVISPAHFTENRVFFKTRFLPQASRVRAAMKRLNKEQDLLSH